MYILLSTYNTCFELEAKTLEGYSDVFRLRRRPRAPLFDILHYDGRTRAQSTERRQIKRSATVAVPYITLPSLFNRSPLSPCSQSHCDISTSLARPWWFLKTLTHTHTHRSRKGWCTRVRSTMRRIVFSVNYQLSRIVLLYLYVHIYVYIDQDSAPTVSIICLSRNRVSISAHCA